MVESDKIRLAPSLTGADAAQVLAEGLRHFGTYHTHPVAVRRGDRLFPTDRNLVFFYHNRLAGYGLAYRYKRQYLSVSRQLANFRGENFRGELTKVGLPAGTVSRPPPSAPAGDGDSAQQLQQEISRIRSQLEEERARCRALEAHRTSVAATRRDAQQRGLAAAGAAVGWARRRAGRRAGPRVQR